MDIFEALKDLPDFPVYAVAFSGGADSLALLDALSKTVGIKRVAALHYDHGIRGRESAEDAAFCEAFAKSLGVRFFLGKAKKGFLKSPPKGQNQEALARRSRYAFFGRICKREKIGCLLTAHHADDAAETMLMRLIRGSGPRGLSGLKEKVYLEELFPDIRAKVLIARPLLDVASSDCKKYCLENGLPFRTDSTNSDTAYTRNWLRLEIMPKLAARTGEALPLKLRRTAQLLEEQSDFVRRSAYEFLSQNAKEAPFGVLMDIDPFLKAHPALQGEVLRILADPAGSWDFRATKKALEALKLGEKTPITPPGPWRWIVVGGKLVFFREDLSLKKFFKKALKVKKAKARGQGYSDNGAGWLSWLKGERVVFREYLKKGDYEFVNFRNGMRYGFVNGPSRKLGDVFTDANIPLFLRGMIPLVSGGDEIMWVPGWRIARKAAIKEGDEALEITLALPAAEPFKGDTKC